MMSKEDKNQLRELIHQYALNEIFEAMAEQAGILEMTYKKERRPKLSSYFKADQEALNKIR